MKNLFNFKWLLLSIVLSIASINQVWAGSESLNSGNMHYTFNDATDRHYDYNKTDYNHKAVNLGTLTGSFTITSVSFQFSDDWVSHGDQTPYLYLKYSYDNWATKHDWQAYSYSYDWTNYWVYKNPWGYEIASSSSASGNYSLKYYWELNWKNGTSKEINNNTATYEFTYTVMPPDVTSISVSATGDIHGDGTEGNPYIVPYGGTLQLNISSAVQAHPDANSSAQYSVDNTNWGTETGNTQLIFENITSTTPSDWMVYARFHNGTASLTGNQLGKRIYYRAEDRYDVTSITASPTAGGTVSPTSASNVGQYSGVDIEATPYVGYKFNGWSVSTGSGSFESASSKSTTFNPTANSTIQAAFVRTYAYVEGRFRVYNEERDEITTTYSSDSWDNNSRNIPMTYDSENHRFYLRTYMTLAEMTEEHTGTGCEDCTPYFYIKTSTSTSSWDNVIAYRPASGTTIVNATRDNGVNVASSDAENSIWFNNSSEAGYVVLYFDQSKVWYELEPATFTAATNANWSVATNWSPAKVPNIETDVVLTKPVTVDVNTAQAKSVRIIRYGEDYTGKLKIDDEGGLVVAEDIKAKHAADKAYEATTKEDLQIRTGFYGNGGLITGNACAGNEAEYVFYTTAYKYTYLGHSYYINQYIGIPFTSMDANQLYGFNIFVYDPSVDNWRTPGSSTMAPWTSYNLIRKYASDDWSTFYLDGVLNLPGLEGEQVFECGWRGISDDPSIDKDDDHEDYMFANSWTAPISIKDITASNCSGTLGADLVQTIYIFNAGFDGANKSLGGLAGQWSSFPLASSSYMANAVIPATQAFMVTSKKGSTGAKLTLNYNDHVYQPAIDADQINTFPTRAPKRVNTEDTPNVLKIVVRNSDVDADQLYILERGDFSFGFDDSWDGNKIFGLSFAPQIYAVNEGNQMAVSAVPDMEGMKIGFKAGKDVNEYTLSFEYAEDAETLYLYDTDTQAYTQITSEATYSFTTNDTKEHERFVITRKAPQIVTGFEEVEGENVKRAEKFIQDNMIFIRRGDRIYTATGNVVK